MSKIKGMQSLAFENEVYIHGAASVVGKLEGEGPLGKCFDYVEEDPMMDAESWEGAESRMQLKPPGQRWKRRGSGRSRYVDIRRRSSGAVHRFFFQHCGAGAAGIWPVRRLLHHGRSSVPGAMTVAAGYADMFWR